MKTTLTKGGTLLLTASGANFGTAHWSVQESGGGTINGSGIQATYTAPATLTGTFHVVVKGDDANVQAATEIKVLESTDQEYLSLFMTPHVLYAEASSLLPAAENPLPAQSAVVQRTVRGGAKARGRREVISVPPSGVGPIEVGTQALDLVDAPVVWTLLEGPAGGAVDPNTGVYTLPSQPGIYHLIATRTDDPKISGSIEVVVSPSSAAPAKAFSAINSLSIYPYRTVMEPGGEAYLKATPDGATWSLLEGTTAGTLAPTTTVADQEVRYSAPVLPGIFTAEASSVSDATKKAQAVLEVGQRVSVSVSPGVLQVSPGTTCSFTATVGNTTLTTVTWKVIEGANGGSISGSGNSITYTAPSTPGKYHLQAQSVADPNRTSTALVEVTGTGTGTISVQFLNPPTRVEPGTQAVLVASVFGSGNATINWTTSGGAITPDGLWTAPVTPGSVTVTATSAADTSKSASAIIAVARLPHFTSLPSTQAYVGIPFTYTATTVHPDSLPTVLALITGPAGMTLVGAQLAWTPTAGQMGNQFVKLRATDSLGGITEQHWTIVVDVLPVITTFTPAQTRFNFHQGTTITANFTGGTGVIRPGNIPITSGVPLSVGRSAALIYQLTVTNPTGTRVTAYLSVQPSKALVSGSGGDHNLVQEEAAGAVRAWGRNSYGQVGDGTTLDGATPLVVAGLGGTAQSMAAGDRHSLAVLADGSLKGWGRNDNGQLGSGSQASPQLSAVQASGLTNVVAAAAGTSHSLALRQDGSVWAFGLNSSGQLGDGSTTLRSTPVQVPGLSNVVAITAGGTFSLALKADGSVWGWGINSAGQLGLGNTLSPKLSPVQVPGLANVVAIASGATFTLALKVDGTLWAWGSGPIGDGSSSSLVPVQVPLTEKVTLLAPGRSHAVVMGLDGSVWAWGTNFRGALGLGSADSDPHLVPVKIALTNVVDLCAGWEHTLALQKDGTLWAWGTNTEGQSGDRVPVVRLTPTPVPGFNGVKLIRAGTFNSYAVKQDGSLWSWGSSFANGTVSSASTSTPTPIPGLGSVSAIEAGDQAALALLADGTLRSWGNNSSGQLGDGTTNYTQTPVTVAGLSGVTWIAAGWTSNLARTADGNLWAWGLNGKGQLGDGTLLPQLAPVRVQGISGVQQYFPMATSSQQSGEGFSLAVTTDGTLWGWGDNSTGILGSGPDALPHPAPVPVAGVPNLDSFGNVYAGQGSRHALAWDTFGNLWSWGSNTSGQLGQGTTGSFAPPQLVGVYYGYGVVCGGDHSFVIDEDRSVLAWGSNSRGELGDGTTFNRATPTHVPGLADVYDLASGFTFTLATKGDGTLMAWGSDQTGQLGMGRVLQRAAPFEVPSYQLWSLAGAPSITSQPADQTVSGGQSATFSVTATGTGLFTYEWRKHGVPINGATSSTYSISSSVLGDAGSFDVVVTNSVGSATSTAATLLVNMPFIASFTANPTSIGIGESSVLKATFGNGTGSIDQGIGLVSSGASNSVSPTVTTTYTLTVTGPGGASVSRAKVVPVNPGLFSPALNLGTARYSHTATLLPNGKVLIVGGTGDGVNGLTSAELYDPGSGAFTATGSLIDGRYGHTATLLPNGKVLVHGGKFSASLYADAELYNPATGVFTYTSGSVHAARSFHSATLLPNGKVLLAGGRTYTSLYSAELYDPATETFSWTGSLATNRAFHTSTLLPNGKVLIAGGDNGGYLFSAELYDPATGGFSPTGNLGDSRTHHTATLLPYGKVLLVAGWGSQSSEEYDPETGTFGFMRNFVLRGNHTSTLLPNGNVLITGGDAASTFASCKLYNSATGLFSGTNLLGAARTSHTATLLPNGKVLIVGGLGSVSSATSALGSVELYDPQDPSLGVFTTTGSLGTARNNPTSTLLPNGKVLIVGGYNGGYLASAELYDPASGVFAPTGSLSTARAYSSALRLPNGKVLIAGGMGGGYLASAELYDPSTGAFTPTGSLGTARGFHTLTLLPNGKVLIVGGNISNSSVLASAELYDPATGAFTATGSLGTARAYHTATLLPNGKVLIAGGLDHVSGDLVSAELYDPATGAFTPTGSLGTARDTHTATLLPNGKVLNVGGMTNSGALLASAELYDPATGAFTATGNLGTGRQDQRATLLPNGKVLIVGGVDTSAFLASAELYDPTTGAFTATGNLGTARGGHNATLLPNGKVLISGGMNGYLLASAELYQ